MFKPTAIHKTLEQYNETWMCIKFHVIHTVTCKRNLRSQSLKLKRSNLNIGNFSVILNEKIISPPLCLQYETAKHVEYWTVTETGS